MELKEQNPKLENNKNSLALAKGGGTVFVTTALGRFLGFVMHVLFSNILGATGYGLYVLGISVMRFLAVFSLAGYHQSSVRYIALAITEKENDKMAGTVQLGLLTVSSVSAVIGFILFILRDFIAINIFHKPEFSHILTWVALIIPLSTLTFYIGFVLRGMRLVGQEAILRQLLQPALLIIAYLIFWVALREKISPVDLMSLTVIAYIFILGIGIWFLRHYLSSFLGKADRSQWKEIFYYSLPLWLSSIVGIVLLQMDKIMLGIFSSPEQVGIYNAASRIAILLSIVMGVFSPIFSPLIVSAHTKKDSESMQDLYYLVVRWSLLIVLPLFGGFWLFPEFLLRMFGTEFVSGIYVLLFLSIAELVNASVGPAGNILLMTGYQKTATIILSIGSIVACLFNIWLIPLYGALGAAIGTGITIAGINTARILAVKYTLRIHPFRMNLLRIILISIITSGLTWFIRKFFMLHIISLIPIYIGAYLVLAYFFFLDSEDKEVLKWFVQKVKRLS